MKFEDLVKSGIFKPVKDDKEFDAKQIKMGIKVEQEHTKNKDLAKMIAKHHLEEIPDYYTRLLKMEKEAKK